MSLTRGVGLVRPLGQGGGGGSSRGAAVLSTSHPARGLPIWRRPIRARRQIERGRFPELLVHYARGLVCLAGHDLPQALSVFHAAERMQALLVERHALATEVRARMLQTQLALGDIATVRAGLDAVGDEQRDRAEMRIAAAALHLAAAAAALHLAEGEPDEAVEALEPVIDRQAKSMHPLWPVIEASLSDAVAREQLRDHRGAEQSVERALEFAEPEGVVLPFLLVPMRGLLERHPRHRTAHATLLRDILAELVVSPNTVRTHIRHIYAKLGAHDRDAAVARARELGLIAPTLRSR